MQVEESSTCKQSERGGKLDDGLVYIAGSKSLRECSEEAAATRDFRTHMQITRQLQYHFSNTKPITLTITMSGKDSKEERARCPRQTLLGSSRPRYFATPTSTPQSVLTVAKDKGGKDMSSGGFASRAQSTGDKNANNAGQQQNQGQQGGKK